MILGQWGYLALWAKTDRVHDLKELTIGQWRKRWLNHYANEQMTSRLPRNLVEEKHLASEWVPGATSPQSWHSHRAVLGADFNSQPEIVSSFSLISLLPSSSYYVYKTTFCLVCPLWATGQRVWCLGSRVVTRKGIREWTPWLVEGWCHPGVPVPADVTIRLPGI